MYKLQPRTIHMLTMPVIWYMYGSNPTGIIMILYKTVCSAVNFVGPLSLGNSLNPAAL